MLRGCADDSDHIDIVGLHRLLESPLGITRHAGDLSLKVGSGYP